MDIKKENFDIRTAYDMLYLCVCAIKNEKPNIQRVAQMDLLQLYYVSVSHSLVALVCDALERISFVKLQEVWTDEQEETAQKVLAKFKEMKAKSIRKNLLLDNERNKLFAYMEEQGIWYMPLKGSILKDMYPKMGLRQMADNDILFDEGYRKEVRAWFLEQGYEVDRFEKENHDVYKKKPVYNFEMHISLYEYIMKDLWYQYYKNVKEKLLKDENNRYGYHFSDEDFYIYILTHGFKHYDGSGNGVRFLVDLYVYLQKKQEKLDWDYIDRELKLLGVNEFEQSSHQLVEEVFADAENIMADTLKVTNEKMLSFFLVSGTYGTYEQRIVGNLDKMQKEMGTSITKWKYYKNRLFPDFEFMKCRYPEVVKNKALLPIGWLYRGLRGLVLKRKKIIKEIQVVRKQTQKNNFER